MSALKRVLLPIADAAFFPVVYPAAWLLKAIRRRGVHRLPLCRRALLDVGVFPIRNHYYEPLFDMRCLRYSPGQERNLPGIEWNLAGQLSLLASFRFEEELLGMPTSRPARREFYFGNGAFDAGDAEFLYQLIRLRKPSRIVEIGSGQSTLMAIRAVHRNRETTPGYQCEHICIEPYEADWLAQTGVALIRSRVEEVDPAVFAALGPGDLLFIDSSHVIRPQGDVLFEYLELLPSLPPGVIVHVHDIFSPRDYPQRWLVEEVRFWNEQYLLEAFLTHNDRWQVIGALNYLHHHHFAALRAKCPYLTSSHEPGSFWIEKTA